MQKKLLYPTLTLSTNKSKNLQAFAEKLQIVFNNVNTQSFTTMRWSP